jgi:adenylate kinase family enzyme
MKKGIDVKTAVMPTMKRIAIIGCGGSGKTTLATQLGAALGLPVHHLDRLFWRAGWQETPKEEWAAVQRELCAQPAWIMDGNYGGTMPLRLETADTIIFLDYPTAVCLLGAICRWIRYRGRTQPEMTDGCPARLSAEYLRWIWTYRRKRRPDILRQLAGKNAVILRSRRQARRFLESLPR